MSLITKKNSYELLEIEDLTNLLEESFDANHASFQKYLEWKKKINDLKKEIRNDVLSNIDDDLDKLTLELRVIWFEYVQSISNQHLKSPPLHLKKRLPMNNSIDFSYERNIQPTHLERKANLYRENFEKWDHDSIIYSSGMAAISSFFQSYFAMYKPTNLNVLKISAWSDYFETRVLTDLYKRDSIKINSFSNFQDFQEEIENTDIFFVEPVRYNWRLEVFAVDTFINAIANSSTSKLRVLVFDTTLNGHTLEVKDILNKIKNHPNIVLVVINSLLKLDQQGLELSNGGLVTIYTNTLSTVIPKAREFADYMRKVRTILGTGLSYEEIGLLTNKFVFNKYKYQEYCLEVFQNNAYIASSIKTSGIFKEVVHPSLFSKKKWAHAPFIVIHLKEDEDTLENHGFLLALIAALAKEKNVSLYHGSSFGFRNHRYESIIPNITEGKGLFKIAMGKRKGQSIYAVREIINEIASHNNFQSLRNSYPLIKPVSMDVN